MPDETVNSAETVEEILAEESAPKLSDFDPAQVEETLRELVAFDLVLQDHGLSLKVILTDVVRRSLGILI